MYLFNTKEFIGSRNIYSDVQVIKMGLDNAAQ